MRRLKSLVRSKRQCRCRRPGSSKIQEEREVLGSNMRGISIQSGHSELWRSTRREGRMTQARRFKISCRNSSRVRRDRPWRYRRQLKTSCRRLLRRKCHRSEEAEVQDVVRGMERRQLQLQMRLLRWNESMIKKASRQCGRICTKNKI